MACKRSGVQIPLAPPEKSLVRGAFSISSEVVENGWRSQVERSQLEFGYVWGSWMASKPTVRWNESAGRWMAWVRFPDGVAPQGRAGRQGGGPAGPRRAAVAPGPGARAAAPPRAGGVVRPGDRRLARGRLPDRLADERRRVTPGRSRRTPIANARYLLDGHVRPAIGRLWVDRTATGPAGGALRRHGARGLRRRAPSTGRGST